MQSGGLPGIVGKSVGVPCRVDLGLASGQGTFFGGVRVTFLEVGARVLWNAVVLELRAPADSEGRGLRFLREEHVQLEDAVACVDQVDGFASSLVTKGGRYPDGVNVVFGLLEVSRAGKQAALGCDGAVLGGGCDVLVEVACTDSISLRVSKEGVVACLGGICIGAITLIDCAEVQVCTEASNPGA